MEPLRTPKLLESTQPAWEAGVGVSAGDREEEGSGFSEEFPELVQVREKTVKAASQAPSRVLMRQAEHRSDDEAPASHVVGLQPSQAQEECNLLKTTQGNGTPTSLPGLKSISLNFPGNGCVCLNAERLA